MTTKALAKMTFENALALWANGSTVSAVERETLHGFYMIGKMRGACELAERAPLQALQGGVLDALAENIAKDPT